MASVSEMIDQLRGFDLERKLGLRPEHPRMALEIDRSALTLVRLKAKRRGRLQLESYRVQTLAAEQVPTTISDPNLAGLEGLAQPMRALFEASGDKDKLETYRKQLLAHGQGK